MIELTDENYYEDKSYLSFSRYKRYLECEAKAYASDFWDYNENTDDTALLVGNYVHSFFESEEAHKKFVEKNKEKLLAKTGKSKGSLKSNFLIAQNMIDALKDDDSFNRLYHGFSSDDVKKEMIVTGTINGVPVKGKLDSVNLSRGYFVDLKTMKTIYTKDWNNDLKKRVAGAANNILSFSYHGQLALYRELLNQMTGVEFRPIIVAVSKETQPDKEVISIGESWLEEGLQNIVENIDHVWKVANGEVKPQKCGHCNYCKAQKKLGRVVTLDELIELY